MTARMTATREALKSTMCGEFGRAAALAEVEETETRLAQAQDQASRYAADAKYWSDLYTESTAVKARLALIARAVAAEAERDSDTEALLALCNGLFPDFAWDGCYDADDLRAHLQGQIGQERAERDKLKEALTEILGHELVQSHPYGIHTIEVARAALAAPGNTT